MNAWPLASIQIDAVHGETHSIEFAFVGWGDEEGGGVVDEATTRSLRSAKRCSVSSYMRRPSFNTTASKLNECLRAASLIFFFFHSIMAILSPNSIIMLDKRK